MQALLGLLAGLIHFSFLVPVLGLHAGLAGVAGAVLGWGLLMLAILDVEHFWLPDRVSAAVGADLALAAIAALYLAATGRRGMGGGDPKLFAAIGASLGWTVLPFVLLLAAPLGVTLAGLDGLRGRSFDRLTQLPFGALRAVAAWPVWLVSSLAPALLVRP